MTTRLLLVGDTHCGLKVGAWPANFKDEYGKRTSLGAAQKLIWKLRNNVAKGLRDEVDKVILVGMGDYCHGPGEDYPAEMETTAGIIQAKAFLKFVKPLKEQADQIYIIDDASAHHVDQARFGADYIAQKLGAFKEQAYIKLDLKIEDLLVHLKHHGPGLGYTPHTRGNPVRAHLRYLHQEAILKGREAPDISIAAHWHQFWPEQLRVSFPGGHKMLYHYHTPALCAADERTLRNVKRLILSDIGMLIIDIDKDYHRVNENFIHQFDNTVLINTNEEKSNV